MTQEGLENLKAVMRKAIELQVNAVLVMATLQSIYCDEYGELDGDTGEQLLFATDSTRKLMEYAIGTSGLIRKAYEAEKSLADLDKLLDNKQDNDTARTK